MPPQIYAWPNPLFKVLKLTQPTSYLVTPPKGETKGTEWKPLQIPVIVILYPVEPEVSKFRDLSFRSAISIALC